jgi:hypothetical protein
MSPHTLAEAWKIETAERGANPATPGYEGARSLFYAGAAATLAMLSHARNLETVYNALQTVKAEIVQYLDEVGDDA